MLDDVAWLRGHRAGGRSSSSATPRRTAGAPPEAPGERPPRPSSSLPSGWCVRRRGTPVPIGRHGAGMLAPTCAHPVPVEGTSP